MKTSTKIVLAASLIGVLGLGGLVRSVKAQPSSSPVAVMSQHHNGNQVAEASDGDGETNDDAKETQEGAKLQSLAKISPQQAQQVAESVQGAKASSVKLENENGNLVYAVAKQVFVTSFINRKLQAVNDWGERFVSFQKNQAGEISCKKC
jgi:hypothetical protein